jgi:hypothetical protein
MTNKELITALQPRLIGVTRIATKTIIKPLERFSPGTTVVAKRANGTTLTGTAWTSTIVSVTGMVTGNVEVVAT